MMELLHGLLHGLLQVPGGWIYDAFFYDGLPDDGDVAARAALATVLGLVGWLTVLLPLCALWARRRTGSKPQAPRAPAASTSSSSAALAAPWWRRSPVGWWSVVWRAQMAHLALYAAVPLAWEAVRGALVALTLPLWVTGPGTGPGASDGTLAHLTAPACWTFVTFCPGPRSHFLHAPTVDASTCTRAGACAPGAARVGDTGGWLWKAWWLGLTLAWVCGRSRGRGRPRSPPPS